MEEQRLTGNMEPAPIPHNLVIHGWLLIYKAAMQSLMSKFWTGEIAVVINFNDIVYI